MMATTHYKQRKQRLKEFNQKAKSVLNEEDRNYLYVVLKEYQQYREIDQLVDRLKSTLNTPDKLNLLVPIRNLLPQAHLRYFDKNAPYSEMAHPFVPPVQHSNTVPRRIRSANHLPHQYHNHHPGPAQRRHGHSPVTYHKEYSMNSMPNRGHPRNVHADGELRKYRSYGTLPTKSQKPKIVLDGPGDISLREDPGMFKVITIIRDMDESLGFSIRGGSEHGLGIFVSEVDAGSVADRAGLTPGDSIVEVNNVSFENLASSSAVKVLAGSNRLKIVVKRVGKIPDFKFAREKTSWFDTGSRRLVEGDLEDHGSMHNLPYLNGEQERRINLTLTGQQCLGFNIRGGSEYGVGIFVSKVDRGGLAEQTGMKPGDQIVNVNGVDFENISHSNAVDFIKGHDQLVMTIRDVGKIPAYKEIYAEYDWIDGLTTLPRNSYRSYTTPVKRRDVPLQLDMDHLDYLVNNHNSSFELSPSSHAASEPALAMLGSYPKSYPLLDDTSIGAPSTSAPSTSAGVQTEGVEYIIPADTPINKRISSAVYHLNSPQEGSVSDSDSDHNSLGEDAVVLQSYRINQSDLLVPPQDIPVPNTYRDISASQSELISQRLDSASHNRVPLHGDLIVAQSSDVTMVQRSPESQRSGLSSGKKSGKKDKKSDAPRSVVGVKALQRENMENLEVNTELFRDDTGAPSQTQSLRVDLGTSEKTSDTWNEKDKSKKSRSLKEKIFGSKKGSSKVKSRKPLSAVNFSKKSKSKEKDIDKEPAVTPSTSGSANGGDSIFQKGLGSQLMLQEAMQQSALAMVQNTAQKLLNEDEVTAVMRHIKRYEAERKVEALAAPIMAILDKPEKIVLLREIRGIIYPPDLIKFDNLVSRKEMSAYEELSIQMDEGKLSAVMRRKSRSYGRSHNSYPGGVVHGPLTGSTLYYEGNFELKSKSQNPRISTGSAADMALGHLNGIASKDDQVFYDEERGVYEIRRGIGSTKIYKANVSGNGSSQNLAAQGKKKGHKSKSVPQNGNANSSKMGTNNIEVSNQNSFNRDSIEDPNYATVQVEVHTAGQQSYPAIHITQPEFTSHSESQPVTSADVNDLYAKVVKKEKRFEGDTEAGSTAYEDMLIGASYADTLDAAPVEITATADEDSCSTISSCSSSVGGGADSYDFIDASQVAPHEYDPLAHISGADIAVSEPSPIPSPEMRVKSLNYEQQSEPVLVNSQYMEPISPPAVFKDSADSPPLQPSPPPLSPRQQSHRQPSPTRPPSPPPQPSPPRESSPQLSLYSAKSGKSASINADLNMPSPTLSVKSLRDVQKNRRNTTRSSPVASVRDRKFSRSPSPTADLMATMADLDNHLKSNDWDSISSSTLQDHQPVQSEDTTVVYTHRYNDGHSDMSASNPVNEAVSEEIILTSEVIKKQSSPVFHAPPPPSISPPPDEDVSIAIGTSEFSGYSGNNGFGSPISSRQPLTINVTDDWKSPLGGDSPGGSEDSTPVASPGITSPATFSISSGGSVNSSPVSTPRELIDSPAVSPPSSPGKMFTVKLSKTRASLGVSISGGKDSRKQPQIKVEKVFDGGAAADSGLLKSGMHLVSINGESLEQATHAEAVNMIRRAYANKRDPVMTLMLLPGS